MNPVVRTLRLKPTKTGEYRVAYSRREALTMINPHFPLSQFRQWEEMGIIPASIFLWETPHYTPRQVSLLKVWMSGRLVAAGINPQTYLSEHWNEPDEEEESDQ